MTEMRSQRDMRALMRPYWRAAALFSLAVNILFLVSPIYMLQVYDRVLTTGSMPTLILLSGIAVFLLVIYLFAEAGRKRVFSRAAEALGTSLAGPTLRRGLSDPAAGRTQTLSAAAQLNTVQGALQQGLPGTILDLPFSPFFLLVLFIVHPVLGAVGLGGALLLVGLALLNQRMTERPLAEAGQAESAAQTELAQLVRQQGAILGMGMLDRALGRWLAIRAQASDASLEAGLPSTFLGAATRSFRLVLQVAVLGTGAFLAVRGEVSAGAIIAASILFGRAVAPIDQAVNGWKQLSSTIEAWRGLGAWLGEGHAEQTPPTPLPRPEPVLEFEELQVTIPGADKPLLAPIDHSFEAGRIVALLGSSGSGKTSLLQTVAGAWPPLDGAARLGKRDMARWDSSDRGRYIGYLPQHVELLRGSIFENIARFEDTAPERVFAAARLAHCHDLILSFPEGYDTKIGEGGHFLSAGERQAVGLARAFFGNPALIVLDEPTAHLDADLVRGLLTTIAELSRKRPEDRQQTIIMATHDIRLIGAADDVMVIRERTTQVIPRSDYLDRVSELRRGKPSSEGTSTPLTVSLKRREPDNG
ncbi:ATP-binding cassette domain-containing protein [Parvularcula sp. ZS-1/3]|uniref:ATP-binding cassette domain-containing protein n=1 Tax=Parvularcula mediterranea TaxID=2732508 RepID=A0A7Y3W6A7_9PROT|nr:ATP-binding cassette domain-containing protein [Parvularcula mediterranea]NNU17660.1 ATP-binding cassette domain-containing protein [Parvularcula mediterranea]